MSSLVNPKYIIMATLEDVRTGEIRRVLNSYATTTETDALRAWNIIVTSQAIDQSSSAIKVAKKKHRDRIESSAFGKFAVDEFERTVYAYCDSGDLRIKFFMTRPTPDGPIVRTMSPQEIMSAYRPGSHPEPWNWLNEMLDIARRDSVQMESMFKGEPSTDPVLLGNDGRVWDGHHRIIVALLRGDASIPYTNAEEEASP